MVDRPFKVGDTVVLANPNTKYGYNGVSRERWKEHAECRIEEIDIRYGEGEIAAYWVRFVSDETRTHMVHSMIEPAGGPW